MVCSLGVFFTSALFGKESNIHTLNTIIIIGAIMAHSDANIKTYLLLVSFPLLMTLYLFLTDFTLFDAYFVLPSEKQLQISDNVFFISMVSALVATLFYIYRTRRASERLKLSKDALSRRYNELEKINQEMDRFVYSVSHDLRAPVVSALGLVELSLKEDNLESIKQYLKLQDKSLWKLEKFIAEILTYSRNARLEINKDKIDFQSIVNESIQLQNLHLPNSSLSISTHLEVNVPFFSDHQRLQAVFNNLISNTARYRDTAKAHSLLEINVKTCPEFCTITLTDNGQGIEENSSPEFLKCFIGHTIAPKAQD